MRIVTQRGEMDCGLSSLAMLLNLRYEDVFVIAAKLHPKKHGLNLKQLESIAKALQQPLIRIYRGSYDLENDSGVLGVLWNKPKEQRSPGGHYVTLQHGSILDPVQANNLYDATEYFVVHDARPATLLTLG